MRSGQRPGKQKRQADSVSWLCGFILLWIHVFHCSSLFDVPEDDTNQCDAKDPHFWEPVEAKVSQTLRRIQGMTFDDICIA